MWIIGEADRWRGWTQRLTARIRVGDLPDVVVGKIQVIRSLVFRIGRRFQTIARSDRICDRLSVVKVVYCCVIGEYLLINPPLQIAVERRDLILRIGNASQRSAAAPAKLRCPVQGIRG